MTLTPRELPEVLILVFMVCVYGCVWLCVFVCVCVCGCGGALNVRLDVTLLMAHPGLALNFLPHGGDGVSWHLLPKAPWGTIHLSHSHYFILAFVSPSCFSDVPGLGKDQGATGLWFFPTFLQMGS